MTYLVQFGGYTFPSGFAPMSQESPKDLGEQERPRGAGAIVQSARSKSRTLSLEGSAMGFGGGPGAIQAATDAIRGACEGSGAVQKLFFGRSDRFILAQLSGVTESYKESGDGSWYGASHKLLLSFLAGDPNFYDNAGPVDAPGLIATGGTVTPGGNAPTYATWSIGIMGGGTGTIALSNAVTGEACTLGTPQTVWNADDSVVLTRDGAAVYTVTLNGSPRARPSGGPHSDAGRWRERPRAFADRRTGADGPRLHLHRPLAELVLRFD